MILQGIVSKTLSPQLSNHFQDPLQRRPRAGASAVRRLRLSGGARGEGRQRLGLPERGRRRHCLHGHQPVNANRKKKPGNNASKNMYSTNTYLSYAISHTFGCSVFSITDCGEATKYRTRKTKRCAEDLNYKKSESTNVLNNHACEQHFFF